MAIASWFLACVCRRLVVGYVFVIAVCCLLLPVVRCDGVLLCACCVVVSVGVVVRCVLSVVCSLLIVMCLCCIMFEVCCCLSIIVRCL